MVISLTIPTKDSGTWALDFTSYNISSSQDLGDSIDLGNTYGLVTKLSVAELTLGNYR